MGKIQAGILSKVSGKVAGVVGGSWKDKAYLRAYTIPSNPNTEAQQAQRNAFKACVEFALPLVGQVFNKYTDPFLKSMSGYNFFIKSNIAHFTSEGFDDQVKITQGKLFFSAPSSPIYNSANGELTFNWSSATGNNGSASDKVFGVAYHTATKLFYFFESEDTRDGSPHVITLPTGLTANNVLTWTFAAKYVGGVLNMISDSIYREATQPG